MIRAEGHILMPVYHHTDKTRSNVMHYESRLKAMVGPMVYEEVYETSVKIYKQISETEATKKSYTDWLESYLKRAVSKMMLDEGVVFTYQ